MTNITLAAVLLASSVTIAVAARHVIPVPTSPNVVLALSTRSDVFILDQQLTMDDCIAERDVTIAAANALHADVAIVTCR